jgi:hypothetical protein
MAYSPPKKTKKLRQPPHLLAKWPFRPYFSRQWPNRRLPQCRKSRQSHCKLPKIVMSKSLRKSKLILWLIMATLKTKKASRPKQSPPKMANPSRKHPKSPNRNPSYPLRCSSGKSVPPNLAKNSLTTSSKPKLSGKLSKSPLSPWFQTKVTQKWGKMSQKVSDQKKFLVNSLFSWAKFSRTATPSVKMPSFLPWRSWLLRLS